MTSTSDSHPKSPFSEVITRLRNSKAARRERVAKLKAALESEEIADREDEIRLSAFQEAEEMLRNNGVSAGEALSESSSAQDIPPTTPQREGPVTWPDVFKKLHADGVAVFGYDDLVMGASVLGYGEVRRASCRAVMMTYVDKGWLERDKPGKFRITDLGKNQMRIEDTPATERLLNDVVADPVATGECVRTALSGQIETPRPRLWES